METLGEILLGIWIVILVAAIVVVVGAFFAVVALITLPFIIIASVFL